MSHEEHMRRAVALSRAKMREDEGGPPAAAIGFDDELLDREFAVPRSARTLPAERLLADEAIAVFRERMADPDRVPY